ncbi:hypothetical protein Dimus_036697, partial [Dionaea muscipula]
EIVSADRKHDAHHHSPRKPITAACFTSNTSTSNPNHYPIDPQQGIEQKLIDMHNRGIEIEIKQRPTEEKQGNWNLIELTDGKACLPVFTARKSPRLGWNCCWS